MNQKEQFLMSHPLFKIIMNKKEDAKSFNQFLATVDQVGTNDPVMTVLENDFKNVTIVRNGVGDYIINVPTQLTEGKTLPDIGIPQVDADGNKIILTRENNNAFRLITKNQADIDADGILNQYILEFKVYTTPGELLKEFLPILNLIITDLGGVGNHSSRLSALNEICQLQSGTGTNLTSLSAVNELCTLNSAETTLVESSSLQNLYAALDGVGSFTTQLAYWNAIQQERLLFDGLVPTLLSATAISDVQIDLSWTVNSTNREGHRIYISTDNVNFTLKGTVIGDVAVYSATELTEDTLYYFKVVAYRGLIESIPATVSVGTEVNVLLPTLNLIIVDLGGVEQTTKLAALNEICTLVGGVGNHATTLDAVNELCTLNSAETTLVEFTSLQNLYIALGGVGSFTTELAYWSAIQQGGLLNQNLPADLLAKFLFLWTGKFDGDNLLSDLDSSVITVNNKDFATTYIPDDSLASFNIPDNATYKTADEDFFWASSGGVVLNRVVTEMALVDNTRTFIKYSNTAPYDVSAIGILKTGEVLTDADKITLDKYFQLWMYYWGTLSDTGYLKDNRSVDPINTDLNLTYTLDSGTDRFIKLTGKSGEAATVIDWGDGTTTTLTMDGTEKTLSHTYDSGGTKNVKFTNCHNLLSFNAIAGIGYYRLGGSIEEFSKCTKLTSLFITGDNVNGGFSGNIEKLPPSITTLRLANLPSTMIGSASNLSTRLTSMTINGVAGITCNLSTLNVRYAGMITLSLSGFGAGKLTGSINYMPANLESLSIAANNAGITGSSSSLPAGLLTLSLELFGNSTTITAIGLPRSITSLTLYGLRGQATGTLAQLPPNLTYLLLSNAQYTGVIESLPASLLTLNLTGADVSNTYGGGAVPVWANLAATIQKAWTTSVLDNFLNSWATTAGAGTKEWNLAGSNQARSAASDAAVTTLNGLGKTFTFTNN